MFSTIAIPAQASYEILDNPPEAKYDALTALAALLCDAPIAAVSLVAAERQWFKSTFGHPAGETPRVMSLCSDVVADGAALVVPDATKDDRYRRNELVTGTPRIRSYLGVPLVGRDGLPLGALCVMDRRPRRFTQRHVKTMRDLADQVVVLLEQHRRDQTDGLLSAHLLDDARDPSRLRRALEDGELVPFYQPIIDLRTGLAHQLEALLRWQHPELGPLPPASFLPTIVAGAPIVPVGRVVLDAALAHLPELRRPVSACPVGSRSTSPAASWPGRAWPATS